jgi:hypothetical protein
MPVLTGRWAVWSAAGPSAIDGQRERASQDGRYLAFVSTASNLVSGYSFTPGVQNVFRFDRLTGHIDLVSVNAAGTGGGDSGSGFPVISGDGSVVVFVSLADDLSALDTNGHTQDVFARNLTTSTTSLISVNSAGTGSGNADSLDPVISTDGHMVAFDSRASNLSAIDTNGSTLDVFARNLTTNTTTLVSVNSNGTGSGNYDSYAPVISANGNIVAFESLAGNLTRAHLFAPVDQNSGTEEEYSGGYYNVFSRNLTTSTTSVVSVEFSHVDLVNRNYSNPQIVGDFFNPVISADGNAVAFDGFIYHWGYNFNNDIVPRQRFTASGPRNVYVRNLDLTPPSFGELVDRNGTTGQGGNADSFGPVISADGSVVAYQSYASNMSTLPDTNGTLDVFVRNRKNPGYSSALVSVNSSGTGSGNNASGSPVISADGTTVAFESLASDLSSLDTNGNTDDIFVRNVATGTTRLLSANSAGTDSGNGASFNAVISADGSAVAFNSDASNLVGGDNNGFVDVFLANIPKLVTSASFKPGSGSAVGSAIPEDSAVLSGGVNETGPLTFVLIAPDNTVVDTETVIPSGDGTYSTSNTHVATQGGTYTWKVSYAGDSVNYPAQDQGGAAERLIVIKARPTLVTTASFKTGTSNVIGSATSATTVPISARGWRSAPRPAIVEMISRAWRKSGH